MATASSAAAILAACAGTPAATPTTAPSAPTIAPTHGPSPTETQAASNVPEATAVGTKAATAAAAPAVNLPPNLDAYENAKREETLILDNPYRFEGADNWNPLVPGNAGSWGMGTVTKEPFVYLNQKTGKLEPWLAESVTHNQDFTAWTVKLKQGITWTDGVPMTIDDVVYSFNIQMQTKDLGAYYTYQEWISKVEKVDDSTATITLKKPDPRFDYDRFRSICGYDWVVPKHIWEKVSDPLTFKNLDIKAGIPYGTGPYILSKITTNEAHWVRNDNWWAAKAGFRKLPEPKKIIYTYGGTEEVRVGIAANNGLDGLQDITLDSFLALTARNKNWQAFRPQLPYVWQDPCARTLSINCGAAPWDDKDMRWVLSYVMDRPQIISVAYEGTTIPGAYPWPLYPSMQKYTDLISQATQDKFAKPNTTEAANILKSKGYTKNGQYWQKGGNQLALEIQVNEAFTELERIADVYVEQLQKFGINGVKQVLTSQTWGDDDSFGRYQAQSGWQTCGSIMEPYSTLRTMASPDGVAPVGSRPTAGQNIFRYNNKQYTDIVMKLGTLGIDDPQYLDLTKQALDIFYAELPVVPMAQSRKLIPWNGTYWTNFPTAANYYEWPVLWCSSFINVLPEIKSTKA